MSQMKKISIDEIPKPRVPSADEMTRTIVVSTEDMLNRLETKRNLPSWKARIAREISSSIKGYYSPNIYKNGQDVTFDWPSGGLLLCIEDEYFALSQLIPISGGVSYTYKAVEEKIPIHNKNTLILVLQNLLPRV